MALHFIILQGFLFTLTLSPVASNRIPNVALTGKAIQSSLTNALKAIDGNKDTIFAHGSCTVTNTESNPWWNVDLQQMYKILAIILTSSDEESYSLDGAEVWIDTSLDPNVTTRTRCGVIPSFQVARSLYLSCNALEGQFVTVSLPGEGRILSLCEVEVYSTDFAYPVPNVAVKGEASQSSTLYPAGAYRAIDGRRLTFYTEGSCSHTAGAETDPWWRVDLGQSFIVSTVKVTNRGDCCPERLDGAEIHIGNSLENNGNDNPRCATVPHIPLGNTFTFSCESGSMQGRYVSVVIPGDMKTLTLCEVEVYGNPAVEPLQNVAFFKTTSQSSTYLNSYGMIYGFSNKAVNWCVDHSFTQTCCTQTTVEHYPWWRVDLGVVHKVSAVTIYNRGDGCSYYIIGAKIQIAKARCTVISSSDLKQTFYCSEMEGRYVTVKIPRINAVLTMCRVEVYGSPVEPQVLPTPSPPPTVPSFNLSVSMQLGDRTATLVGGRLCWSDALQYCRLNKWDLLSVHSQDEQTQVEQLLATSPFPLTDHVWLGLRRDLMGVRWFWMSGEAVVFNKWLMYPLLFPNPCGGMESADSLSWKPMPCEHLYNFICQTAPAHGTEKVYYYSHVVTNP